MIIDQASSLSIVVGLAQAEGRTYRTRTAFYRKTVTLRASRKPVMLIANPLDEPLEDYSTGPPSRFEPEQDPFSLLPEADRTTEILTPASYCIADDRVETLYITTKKKHLLPLRILLMSGQQVRETLAMLTQNDTCIPCWLCRDGDTMYRCPYLTFKQEFFTAYRNFKYRTAADAGTGRLLMQKAQEIDPCPYVARLRQAHYTVRFLTEDPRKPESPSPRQRRCWTPSLRRESRILPYLPSVELRRARRSLTLPDRRDFCVRFYKQICS